MQRGGLLFEYRPPRAHPILYAALLVFAFVFVTGAVENLLRDNRPSIYFVYAAPFAVTAFVMAALWPSDVRIYANGIAPSRPMVLRWRRPFVSWDGLAAVYPSYYDVTGAFLSPFASSDGKVTQMGLGLEWPDGRTETVAFTPSRFSMASRRSRGYREALGIVEEIFRERGRPMVAHAPSFSADERAKMLAQARRPFLPFFAIVFLFASAAPIMLVLLRVGLATPVALAVGLSVPLAVSLRSLVKSRERNRILNTLSKSAEFERRGAA